MISNSIPLLNYPFKNFNCKEILIFLNKTKQTDVRKIIGYIVHVQFFSLSLSHCYSHFLSSCQYHCL